ncbi:hypothetical protein H072_3107 [Dactylellina haptotyla CBS 200.50]|uniref:Mediator complex subunit 15 KIX domain-containing protein n=1 Tax=Dactylellina haptotyla (strain CBS 200.50) TaxID=1284197 RepID=S8AIV0_DACHA|nr:hypothetical protein H072_3107 [Dactylellina haptotyla CBS 200.50]
MRASSQGSTGSIGGGSAGGAIQQRRYSRYSKKMERPYPKGDITVEIQKRAQELLREAAQKYEGFNADNLKIIAVSFEHKTFLESANSTDYVKKIRDKLTEWHYQDAANPPPAPLKDTKSSPSAQKKGSDSSSGPVKVTNQRPPSRDKSKTGSGVLNSAFKSAGGSPNMPNATQPAGGSPNFNFGAPASPGSGNNNQPTTPPFAPFSPTINPTGEFVGLTHPTLLDSLDLNDPNIRTQWINALRESIISDLRDQIFAEAYGSLGSNPGMSGLMNSPTRNGHVDFSMMEVDHHQNQQHHAGNGAQTNGGAAAAAANGGYGMDGQSWYTSYNPAAAHAAAMGNPSAGGGLYQPIGTDAQSFNQHMVGNWYNHQ